MNLKRMLALGVLAAALGSSTAGAQQGNCPDGFNVYFEAGSATINAAGQELVAELGKGLQACSPRLVVVTGHLDAKEAAAPTTLGQARATAVAAALRAHVSAAPVVTEDAGFSSPQLQTAAGESHPLNRRASIDSL